MTKTEKMNKTLDLANYVFDNPSDLRHVSDLIETLNEQSFGIDQKIIDDLNDSKIFTLRVQDLVSTIISKLNIQLLK